MNLTKNHKLRKLYKIAFDIARFPAEKRTPYSGLDIENITDPTAMIQRDRVSIWFNPDSKAWNAKVPHDDKFLVFRGYHDIECSGYFHGKPKIDVYTPGAWEEILDQIWKRVIEDEKAMRKK